MAAPKTNGGAGKSRRANGHALTECRCPLCQSVLDPAVYEAVVGALSLRDSEIESAAATRFAAREETVRQEATAAANAATAGKIAKAEEARKLAEQAVKAAKVEFETALRERLEAQAEAAAKARDAAISEVTVKHFAEVQRLLEKNREMERLLEKKTANELGENGELDLFEVLTNEFPADEITRIGRGVNGPDILHRVFNGGVFTRRSVVYEAKNHKTFQSKWLTKARRDQADYQADHIVIVSAVLPAGRSQLMVENGVVVCTPARVAAIAHMLRRAVLQTHILGLTNADRDEKTARLYDLMVSDRASERWDRISSATSDLVEIESSDAEHQQRVRKKRLGLITVVRDAHSEFTCDIDTILRGEPGDLP